MWKRNYKRIEDKNVNFRSKVPNFPFKGDDYGEMVLKQMILDEGYEIVEMAQFRPGANYAIFRKPGKQNPVIYKISEIKVE